MRSLVRSNLFALLAGTAICRAAAGDDDGSEPLGVISLEDNLSEVEKPPEIPANRYKAELQDVQLPTSGKGNQYFAMKWVIPPEELPADVRDAYPDGATLYYNRIIVPTKGNRRALWNLRQFLESIGEDINTQEIDPSAWMGKEAVVVVRMGTYQGEKRAEIGSILPAESGRVTATRATARTTATASTTKSKPSRRGR